MKRGNRFIDLTGQVFGRLKVRSLAENQPTRHLRWDCDCSCGGTTTVQGLHLKTGDVSSCGCLALEVRSQTGKRNRRHGMSGTSEYQAYAQAKSRCTAPTHRAWGEYGGRGIEFRFNSFEEFIEHIGLKPSPEHSLDRYPNNDGHYEKGNVRWATESEQNLNRRPYQTWKFAAHAA